MITAMPNSLGRACRPGARTFGAVLGAGWVLLGSVALVYARMKGIPAWTALPVGAAFLLEFSFYLCPGFEGPLAWLGCLDRTRIAAILSATALIPWCLYSLATGAFRPEAFFPLLLIAVAVSFWYIVLKPGPIADILFLIMLAALILTKAFDLIYLSPIPKQSISILGHVMLVRTAAIAILTIRRDVVVSFDFWPRREDWLTGLRYFLLMLPCVAIPYWALGLVVLRPHPLNAALAAGTFFGILWIVALSEEFFFRGLIQQWLEQWTGSPTRALAMASGLFGMAHLGFRHSFPNWRWVIIATIIGVFCGLAWRRSRRIQASMVTHALLVTFWRVFFQ